VRGAKWLDTRLGLGGHIPGSIVAYEARLGGFYKVKLQGNCFVSRTLWAILSACILVWGAVQTKKALEDVAAGNFTERTWVLPCTDKRFCSGASCPRGSQTVLRRPFLRR